MKKIILSLLAVTGFFLQTFGQVNSENGFRFKNNTQMKGLIWGNTNWLNYFSRIDDFAGQLMIMTDDHIYFSDINTANGTPLGAAMYINTNNGTVGIGTTSPGQELEVNGDILLRNFSGNRKQIYTWNSSDENWRIGMNQDPGFTRNLATSHVQYLTYSTSPGQGFAVGANGGNSSFEIRGSDHAAFFRGHVGIGTTTTGTHDLAVEGSIGAREIRVEVGAWSDFVFKSTYTLYPSGQLRV